MTRSLGEYPKYFVATSGKMSPLASCVPICWNKTIGASRLVVKAAQNYYFIEQGCLRLFFDNNGKDTTVQFFFENDGVSSLESFQKNIPSVFSIETIEPSILQILPKAVFNAMLMELDQNTESFNADSSSTFDKK